MTEIKTLILNCLNKIKTDENGFMKYYITKLKPYSEKTILNDLIAIHKLYNQIGKDNPKEMTEDDMLSFLDSDWWNNLNRTTRTMYISKIRKLFSFYNKEDLVNLLPKIPKNKQKVLSANELITRDDLSLMIENSRLKFRTLIMVMYEGALRKGELMNILYKDIKFNGGYINLYIRESKTEERNIPLIESIPFLREYFNSNKFEPNDIIFFYKNPASLNVIFNALAERLEKRYSDRWGGKKLYPHLLRHSRLTELATNRKLNEAQIRKFAGWGADSTMPRTYFHLTDDDVIETLTESKVKKAKPKRFEPKICSVCNTVNNLLNIICWKCGNIFDRSKITLEKKEYQEKLKQMNEKIDRLEKAYETILESIKK